MQAVRLGVCLRSAEIRRQDSFDRAAGRFRPGSIHVPELPVPTTYPRGMSLPEPPAPDQVRRKRVRKEAGPGNGHASEVPAVAGGENLPHVQEKSGPPKPGAPKRARRSANGSAQMLIKRSVSPDGRIDSVSVEFSMPVSDISNGEIKEKALKTLQLQKEIVGAFLKLNGEKAPANAAPTPAPVPHGNRGNGDGKPVFARMIDIGKVNGKWGERLCINVQVGAGSSAPPTSSRCKSPGPDTT